MARNKYYFKIRTDGQSGIGTISNPFNGSVVQYFDQGMRSIPADSDIYLGKGTFLTSGYTEGVMPYIVRDGWRIKGAGIDKTILKAVNISTGVGTVRKIVIGMDYNYYCNNCKFENFTIDGNMDNQITSSGIVLGGIGLQGNNNLLRKIKLINFGSRKIGYESFGIGNGGTGCIIDGCIVQSPITGNISDGVTAIYGAGTSSVIKNCYVNLSGYTKTGFSASYSNAYSLFVGVNCQAYNNTCEYCSVGFYDDSTDVQNPTIKNNYFKNVQYGITYNNYTAPGLLRTGYFLKNYISFLDERLYIGDAFYGIKYLGKAAANGASADYILFSGNTIENSNKQYKIGSSTQNAYLASFYNVKTGIVTGNTFNVYDTGDSYFNNRILASRITGIFSGENYSTISIPLQ